MVVANNLVSAKCRLMDTKLGGLVDCCNRSGDASMGLTQGGAVRLDRAEHVPSLPNPSPAHT